MRRLSASSSCGPSPSGRSPSSKKKGGILRGAASTRHTPFVLIFDLEGSKIETKISVSAFEKSFWFLGDRGAGDKEGLLDIFK